MNSQSLDNALTRHLETPAGPGVQRVADAARTRHQGVLAVLFYGSCLREPHEKQQSKDDKVVDLYLLVESYKVVHKNPVMRVLNGWLPPNVYYIEHPFEGATVRAKYAIVTLNQFTDKMTGFHPYFWARFCQPFAVHYASSEAVRLRIIEAARQAILTMLKNTLPLMEEGASSEKIWTKGFTQTYRTELRSEGRERAAEIVNQNKDYYNEITPLAKSLLGQKKQPKGSLQCRWGCRRIIGKILSALRLLKGAVTFDGAAEYILWKIERHSGVHVSLSDWQCRHPILAAPALTWKIYKKGGFR